MEGREQGIPDGGGARRRLSGDRDPSNPPAPARSCPLRSRSHPLLPLARARVKTGPFSEGVSTP
jgi:hypothetical protein